MTTAYKDYVTFEHQALYICMHYGPAQQHAQDLKGRQSQMLVIAHKRPCSVMPMTACNFLNDIELWKVNTTIMITSFYKIDHSF